MGAHGLFFLRFFRRFPALLPRGAAFSARDLWEEQASGGMDKSPRICYNGPTGRTE